MPNEYQTALPDGCWRGASIVAGRSIPKRMISENDLVAEVCRVGTPITRKRPGVPAPKRRNAGRIAMRSRIIRIKSTTAYGADNKAGEVGIRAFVAGKELSPTNPDIQVRGKRNLRPA